MAVIKTETNVNGDTVTLKHFVKSTYHQSRQTIRVVSRKISTMDTRDLDSKVLMKVVTVILGLVLLTYSVQLFLFMLPILYPAYQTIKSLQVILKLW